MEFRIQRVVTQPTRKEAESSSAALKYWLSRPPEERVGAVEFLRRQVLGPDAKLLPVLRVVDCPWG